MTSIPCITVYQPSLLDMWRPYIAGVLNGDGWCTNRTLGLRAKDEEFVRAFAACLGHATGKPREPLQERGGYWLMRTSNVSGHFSKWPDYQPTDNDQAGWWLRGLFDSDGNANICPAKRGGNSFHRRIAIYSTSMSTLTKAAEAMMALDISHAIRSTKNSTTHWGSKAVYELRVLRQDGFVRFADMVGSTIPRKQAVIRQIVESYQPAGWQAVNWQKAIINRWRHK